MQSHSACAVVVMNGANHLPLSSPRPATNPSPGRPCPFLRLRACALACAMHNVAKVTGAATLGATPLRPAALLQFRRGRVCRKWGNAGG
eukprot:201954-Chlamydomonas_euryale.AAC.2